MILGTHSGTAYSTSYREPTPVVGRKARGRWAQQRLAVFQRLRKFPGESRPAVAKALLRGREFSPQGCGCFSRYGRRGSAVLGSFPWGEGSGLWVQVGAGAGRLGDRGRCASLETGITL